MSTALRLIPLPCVEDAEPGAVPVPPLRVVPDPGPAAPAAPRTGGRRVRGVREVVAEVEALRPVLEQAVRQYELRIAAQLEEIVRALQGGSPALDHLPRVRTTTAMLRAIHAAQLKPERGRAKDLVRLHELVAELTELLTPES